MTWSGRHRAPIDGLGVYPRPLQEPLPVWIAVGGTPKSVVRAALLGLPLAVAIIGGEPARFAPLVDLYREAAREGGHDPAALPVSINSHTYVAETSRAGRRRVLPRLRVDDDPHRPRARVAADDARAVRAGRSPRGHLLVGSPQEVADKILAQHELFGHDRFLAQMSLGTLPHAHAMRSTELLGTEVAPLVREETRAPRRRG